MIKPICVRCERFYRPHSNGIYVLEQMPVGKDAAPGTAEPRKWTPYKVWQADQWRCPGCAHLIVVGSGLTPISEHYQDGFEAWRKLTTVQVNDC